MTGRNDSLREDRDFAGGGRGRLCSNHSALDSSLALAELALMERSLVRANWARLVYRARELLTQAS